MTGEMKRSTGTKQVFRSCLGRAQQIRRRSRYTAEKSLVTGFGYLLRAVYSSILRSAVSRYTAIVFVCRYTTVYREPSLYINRDGGGQRSLTPDFHTAIVSVCFLPVSMLATPGSVLSSSRPLQDFHKPFDSPAVLVVGHQTSGKSALIEALMGFQFNQVMFPLEGISVYPGEFFHTVSPQGGVCLRDRDEDVRLECAVLHAWRSVRRND